MKVSIVTTSFNQAAWLFKNLQSVSDQTHENVEHIIIDPGSTDNSREIIDHFASKDDRVVRIYEPDRGQVDAINKGLRLSSGEIVTWLNSDDYYYNENVISAVVNFFEEKKSDIVYGRGLRVDENGKKLSEAYTHPDNTNILKSLESSIGILQPSLFFTKEVFESIGGLDESYNLQLDYEYWIRMAQAGYKFRKLNVLLSKATVHKDAKSTGQRLAQLNECFYLLLRKFGYIHEDWIKRYAEFYVTRKDRKVDKDIKKPVCLQQLEAAVIDELSNYIKAKHYYGKGF
ncbi:MAG: glycosyltransferase family 2 protein [Pseudomonadota bacterium]